MSSISAGAVAPNIELKSTDGSAFSLKTEAAHGPVIATFFKVGCPTCQYTFPFLERVHKAYPRGVKVVGVSQDDAAKTAAFIKEFGLTFPVLLDDTKKYPASNAYGLETVPATFLVDKQGTVEMTMVGWVKEEFQTLVESAAMAAGVATKPIFKAGEDVKDFKAG